jgi:DNA-binding MarR family transcriptional regulator
LQSEGHIATVLTNLEAKALITRRPHPWHRKVAEVQLTDEGQRVLARADAEAVTIERELADGYTPQERAQFAELLARASSLLAGLAPSPQHPPAQAGKTKQP